uniref:oligosaccharide flippase family protein n=1 Tax=Acinetobacter calcoaceticus TaxID=471 RepID=UPI0018DC7AE6
MFKLIFSLAAVTTLAQVLQLISQPLLTHLYTKESFGYLSIVVSIVSFGSIVCNFQFNNLALIEKKNVDNIFVSGLFFSLILELIFFLLLVLFSYHIFKENLFYFIFFTMLY